VSKGKIQANGFVDVGQVEKDWAGPNAVQCGTFQRRERVATSEGGAPFWGIGNRAEKSIKKRRDANNHLDGPRGEGVPKSTELNDVSLSSAKGRKVNYQFSAGKSSFGPVVWGLGSRGEKKSSRKQKRWVTTALEKTRAKPSAQATNGEKKGSTTASFGGKNLKSWTNLHFRARTGGPGRTISTVWGCGVKHGANLIEVNGS